MEFFRCTAPGAYVFSAWRNVVACARLGVGVGDFDGDGRADIVWRNTADGGLAMWRMDGNTTLGVQMVGGAPLSWSIANVGDYNGDGRNDILWHNTDGTVARWTMNGFSVQNQAIVANVPPEWGLI